MRRTLLSLTRLWVAAVSVTQPTPCEAQGPPKESASKDDIVYSACAILRDPNRYEGKKLKMRGLLVGGYHGMFLETGTCPELATEPFEPVVWLTEPSDPLVKPKIEGLKADSTRLRAFFNTAGELKKRAPSGRVWATFCGVVQAQRAYYMTLSNKRRVLFGFGHESLARAQLVYEWAEDASMDRQGGPSESKCRASGE